MGSIHLQLLAGLSEPGFYQAVAALKECGLKVEKSVRGGNVYWLAP